VERQVGRSVSEQELASYLIYPRVFPELAAHQAKYSDTSVLPTPVFFHGMLPGEEVSIDIERGKTLIVKFLTVGEPHVDGTRTVFFELNGQPRAVRIRDQSQAPERPAQPKAERGNERHVGAPMPGVVATIGVKAGDPVARGDLLLTLEAMKMQTAVRADRDGRIAQVHVAAGQQVDAKDLLVELA
jgi:pyruvate carboxylase